MVLNKLLRYAVNKQWLRENPITGSERYKIGTHHTWIDDELKAYADKWPLGTRERLANALSLYTGQRVCDVIWMTRRDIVDGCIHLTQEKTGKEL